MMSACYRATDTRGAIIVCTKVKPIAAMLSMCSLSEQKSEQAANPPSVMGVKVGMKHKLTGIMPTIAWGEA